MGAVGNCVLCGFPSSGGRALCVHGSGGVHSPPWPVPARVAEATRGLAVTPEAPGQLDSLQYRQVQSADVIEQHRGRGPGEGCRQRVPPRPVLVLQRQERLHRVVPLLGPRPPVRPAGGTGRGTRRPSAAPGSAPAAPRSSRPQDAPVHRYVTDRSRRPTSPGMGVSTSRGGGHESGLPVRVEGRRRLRIESPFSSSL